MSAMNGLIQAAVMAFARAGQAEVAAFQRRTMITGLAVSLAALLGIAALGCAVAALWISLVPQIGTAAAALAASGGLLLLCLVALGVTFRMSKKLERRQPSSAPSAELLVAEGARLFKEHQGAVLLAALVAGLLVGNDGKER